MRLSDGCFVRFQDDLSPVIVHMKSSKNLKMEYNWDKSKKNYFPCGISYQN